MPRYDAAETLLLAPYVTNTEDSIYAVKGLPGIVGAVYARYSRAPGGFRDTLLKEFIERKDLNREGWLALVEPLLNELQQKKAAVETTPESTAVDLADYADLHRQLTALADGISTGAAINAKKASALIQRVLIAFGDDSVGELEGAHVSFEDISILATKDIEDRRIGGSPIEQSTRYVFYDMKDEHGHFRYYRDPAVLASAHGKAYVETMDFIFQTYCDLIEPMKAYYSGLKPLEEAEYDVTGTGAKIRLADCADEKSEKAFRITYNADIRTKACDALRAILPIATKTNVGIFGNGRFYQNVLTTCYTSDFPEVQDIAARAQKALDQVIPHYVKRAKRNEYLVAIDRAMTSLAHRLFADVAPAEAEDVVLLDRSANAIEEAYKAGGETSQALHAALMDEEDNLVLASMLYPYLEHPLEQVRAVVRTISAEQKAEIVATYLGTRKTRRDRPGRALEAGYPYTFDMCTDFGTYKDLERHRMATQLRQKYTPMIGFAVPEDIVRAGHAGKVEECVRRARSLYTLLEKDFPLQASYATLHGSLVRWVFGANDRALMHMIELRTTPQGHPSYRKVCQKMHALIAQRWPWRARAMQFADHGDYFWSRGDAEAHQRVKEAKLEKQNA